MVLVNFCELISSFEMAISQEILQELKGLSEGILTRSEKAPKILPHLIQEGCQVDSIPCLRWQYALN